MRFYNAEEKLTGTIVRKTFRENVYDFTIDDGGPTIMAHANQLRKLKKRKALYLRHDTQYMKELFFEPTDTKDFTKFIEVKDK